MVVEKIIENIEVMFVEAPNGPAGSGEAFNKLEGGLASLKGRKFYATFHYATGQYRACVALEAADDPQRLGFETWRIPGGRYAEEKLIDWTQHPDQIPEVFGRLGDEYEGRIDSDRPSIEFYKSQKELVLLLPIR